MRHLLLSLAAVAALAVSAGPADARPLRWTQAYYPGYYTGYYGPTYPGYYPMGSGEYYWPSYAGYYTSYIPTYGYVSPAMPYSYGSYYPGGYSSPMYSSQSSYGR